MKHLVFVTDTIIDIKAFTMFGMNAKPNSISPIGFFGTGLKISIAVLCRLGCKVRVLIDGVEHEFYTKKTNFRGKDFDVVRMRKRNSVLSSWRYQEMSYTTELGKNWEPWQVFRELESNTRDENGSTILTDEAYSKPDKYKGKTVIIVDEPLVIDCYHLRDEIFLRDDLEEKFSNTKVQVFNQPSKYLYYRGMRVLDLPLTSAFTYNILADQRLTEDRTLYSHSALWAVRDIIMSSEDRDFISGIIKLDPEKFWEGKLDFDDSWSMGGATFISVVSEHKDNGLRILPRVQTYYERYFPAEDRDPEVTVTKKRSEWFKIAKLLEENWTLTHSNKELLQFYHEIRDPEDQDENDNLF